MPPCNRMQHPSIRIKLVQALILLRNRGVLDPTELLSLFFGLFHCQASNRRTRNKPVGAETEIGTETEPETSPHPYRTPDFSGNQRAEVEG